jgi:threonine aldolase
LPLIDLRSDALTRPTVAMRAAMAAAGVGDPAGQAVEATRGVLRVA